MTTKSKILILILPVFFNNAIMAMKSSPYVITFFLKPQTEQSAPASSAAETKTPPINTNDTSTLKNPVGTAIKSIVNSMHNTHPQAGIYVTYNGNATVSDMNGQITFLRKVIEPKLDILITKKIEPLLINPLKKNTIEGFVIDPQVKHKLYHLELRENPVNKNYEWIVEEEIISKSKKIPYNTIILFADPNNASISTVKKTVKMDGNLLLPDVYIKPNSDLQLTAISFLKIRQYFSRVKKKYEFKPGLYQERIV